MARQSRCCQNRAVPKLSVPRINSRPHPTLRVCKLCCLQSIRMVLAILAVLGLLGLLGMLDEEEEEEEVVVVVVRRQPRLRTPRVR